MCRNIKTLHNFAPPATDDEIRASALQYVRKLSGTRKPSAQNQAVFDAAVEEVFVATRRLLDAMVPRGTPKNRDEEAQKAKRRFVDRQAKGQR